MLILRDVFLGLRRFEDIQRGSRRRPQRARRRGWTVSCDDGILERRRLPGAPGAPRVPADREGPATCGPSSRRSWRGGTGTNPPPVDPRRFWSTVAAAGAWGPIASAVAAAFRSASVRCRPRRGREPRLTIRCWRSEPEATLETAAAGQAVGMTCRRRPGSPSRARCRRPGAAAGASRAARIASSSTTATVGRNGSATTAPVVRERAATGVAVDEPEKDRAARDRSAVEAGEAPDGHGVGVGAREAESDDRGGRRGVGGGHVQHHAPIRSSAQMTKRPP